MAGFFKRHRKRLWMVGVALFVLIAGAGVLIPRIITTACGGSEASCINNLRQIDGAKEQWALEHKIADGAPVVVSEVNAYIKGGGPKCPQGGTYTYGAVDEPPRCSFGKGHFLP